MQARLGMHHIRTKLFSIPLRLLHQLSNDCFNRPNRNPHSMEYKLTAIISDIAHHRLYKPVSTSNTSNSGKSFLKINFSNKGLDAVNISNILRNKKVMSEIPPYFVEQTAPLISYSYIQPIASKIFNYKKTLNGLVLKDIKSKPPSCSCAMSPFIHSPVGHVVTGDLNIIKNTQLRELLSKGPKFREPQPFNWNHNFRLLMDSVEDYARRWAVREECEVEALSGWIKAIRSLLKSRTKRLRGSMNTKTTRVLDNPNTRRHLSELHDQYVIVPADKAPNNIIFVCKQYYIDCLVKELGIGEALGNPTYTPVALSTSEVLDNHRSALHSFGISCTDEESELPTLYWIPKLHKYPYKQRYIAGSAKCSTKPLSKLLTTILSTVKAGLHKYCETTYSRNSVNQMWILKNSKDLLDNLKSPLLRNISSVKTYDFSTLYTTIPHSDLKACLKHLIYQCFFNKNGKRRYKFMVLGYSSTYFVKSHTDSDRKYTEVDIVNMVNFLIDNIFVVFGGQLYQQTIGIPMGTNCAPLLADLYLHYYEAQFIQGLLKRGQKKLAQTFNHTFRYIDDVLSLNNNKFSDYLHEIYPDELEIKDTTESLHSTSYLDLLLDTHDLRLCTKLYDKRDDFNFTIVNFPFLDSNIPTSPAYGVYMSQLIRYARACSLYIDFLGRALVLTSKLLKQGYLQPRLIATCKKFYGRHHDLVIRYGVPVSQLTADLFMEPSCTFASKN